MKWIDFKQRIVNRIDERYDNYDVLGDSFNDVLDFVEGMVIDERSGNIYLQLESRVLE